MSRVDRTALKQRLSRLRDDILKDLPDRLAVIAGEISALQCLTDKHRREEAVETARKIAYLSHKLAGSLSILELDNVMAITRDIEYGCRDMTQQPEYAQNPEKVAAIVKNFSLLQQTLEEPISRRGLSS